MTTETTTTQPPSKHSADCEHPDACCPACLDEENSLRPDHTPPPPARQWAYKYVGGPLHGRVRVSHTHPDWHTASGKPATTHRRTWLDRRYEADHEARLYRWRPPAPDARYRYSGGPLDGHSFIVGSQVVITTWRTYEGCPIERPDPELDRYYVLDIRSHTYRASPSAGSGSTS